MLVPNRYGSAEKYRYGFQGQEKDDEIKGEGNSMNYTFRMHDPRVGRFFARDPLEKKYPWYTPYQFSGNKVINSRELEGLEEYSSYTAYSLQKGKKALTVMDGSDGAWTTADRKARNSTWSNAMETITRNIDTDNFELYTTRTEYCGDGFNCEYQVLNSPSYSFAIIRDYYNWAQHQMDSKGISSQWAKGASYLVDELESSVLSMKGAGIYDLFKDLNLGIAQFAIGKYNGRLYGNNTKEGWDFDYEFITQEQVTIAAPGIYSKYSGTSALDNANDLARKEGFIGFGAKLFSNHYFPSFATFGVNIDDPKTSFGAGGRQHIPMLMLYTSEHAAYLLKSQGYKCTDAQMKEVNRANKEIEEYYNEQMKY